MAGPAHGGAKYRVHATYPGKVAQDPEGKVPAVPGQVWGTTCEGERQSGSEGEAPVGTWAAVEAVGTGT